MSRSRRSARSSARCSSCAARAATISSASRRSSSTTSWGSTSSGRGIVNILAADRLMASPRLYSTFLLWLLSRTVRAASGGRRPAKAQAVLLLRRGPSAVRRRAAGPARKGRAGRPPDPLQGRRRLFHHAEPDRHPGQGRRPARQPHPARAATPSRRATSRRCKSAADTFRPNPGDRRRHRDHGAEDRRGARLAAPARRLALAGPAHLDQAALVPRRPAHSGRAQGDRQRPTRSARNTTHCSTASPPQEMLAAKADEAAAAAAAAKAQTDADKAAAEKAKPGRHRRQARAARACSASRSGSKLNAARETSGSSRRRSAKRHAAPARRRGRA